MSGYVTLPGPDGDDPVEGVKVAPWEKAIAQNGFSPVFIADYPGVHETMLLDFLQGLADEKFGAGQWVARDAGLVEEFEPIARDRRYEDEDTGEVTGVARRQPLLPHVDVVPAEAGERVTTQSPMARRKHNCPSCPHTVPTPGHHLCRVEVNHRSIWTCQHSGSGSFSFPLGTRDELTYVYAPNHEGGQ